MLEQFSMTYQNDIFCSVLQSSRCFLHITKGEVGFQFSCLRTLSRVCPSLHGKEKTMELVFCPNNLSYSRIHSIFSPFLHKTYAIRNVLQSTEWLAHIKLIKSTTNYWGCEREFSRLHIYIAKKKKKIKKIRMIFHVEFLHFRNRSTLAYKFLLICFRSVLTY